MPESNATEQATPRRKQKAREQGSVPRSRELPAALALAAVVAMTMLIAPNAIRYWETLYRETLNVAATGNIDTNGPVLFWTSIETMRWIAPILMGTLVVSVMSGVAQGGINFAPEALALKPERLSPKSKLGQIFSSAGLSNLLKSLLPFTAILWVVVSAIRSHWVSIVETANLGVRSLASLVGSMFLEVGWKAILILLVWSAADYVLVRRKMNSDLKMTKQEIREEHKETDGNPAIKKRIIQVRRAMRKTQSLKAAATATVVITNPTHFAVALRYETDMAAPIVVAKGRDLLALKIKELARESGIMLIENKPLAQALYKTVEVGDTIPSKLYQAVAEILVMVYKAQAEVRQQEARRRSRNASGQATSTPAAGARPQTGAAR